MSNTVIPAGYKSLLGLYDTQKAIGLFKTIFQEKICGCPALDAELHDGAFSGAYLPF